MHKFDEPESLNSVGNFHHVFDLPIQDDAQIPSPDRCRLRINLIEEELKELKEAIANNDLKEVADAFCDLQYVLSGAILEFGLGKKFKALFDEVQRSNMSKVCTTEEEAKKTVEYYQKVKHTPAFIQEKDGQYLVYRLSDKKVLKSVNYSPADLDSILEEMVVSDK